MGEQLNSIKNGNNLKNFIQSQRKTREEMNLNQYANRTHNNKPLALLELDELFEFLEVNFNEFHEIKNFNAIVPFIHRSIKQWSKNRDTSSIDIGATLFHLFDQRVNDENDITIVVQIIETILNYLKSIKNNKDTQMSEKVFLQLTKILPKIENAKLVSHTISCLQLYIKMHPDKRRAIMQSLWTDLRQQLNEKIENAFPTTTEIDILVKLYDEFYEVNQNISEDATIIAAIQKLLRSDQKDNRKNGYILFRKMITFLVKKLQNFRFLLTLSKQQIVHIFVSYINILENLEEEQSAIIISKLENIKQIVESKQLQTSWLEILYERLLTHGSIEKAYWTMEYFLKNFVYSDLSAYIIEKLFKTSNSMLLYNHEGYCLEPELFKNFLKGDLTLLYELLEDIEWKSIPLYIWIKAIYDNKSEVTPTRITYKQLLSLSARVNNLDCWVIHAEIVKLFEKMFENIISNMSMKQYVEYVETLYRSTKYAYNDFEKFYGKISHLLELDDKEYMFSQQFYEILVKNLPNTYVDVNKFMTFLNKIPREQHGWLRFIPYHYFGNIMDENNEKFNVLYDINTNSLKTCKLEKIIAKFEQCLSIDLQTSHGPLSSVIHCRIAAIAFYTQQKNSFDQEDLETLFIIFGPEISAYNKMIKFPKLWKKLCECLENTNTKLHTWIIDAFLNRVCNSTVGDNILKYLSKTYDENTKNMYFEIILCKYLDIFNNVLHNYVNPLKLSNQSRFFNGDLINKNVYRIEQLFCCNQFDTYVVKPISCLKQIWTNGLKKYCDEEYILYLLDCHKELSKKNPIYKENFNDHLIKLRIAVAIYSIELKNIYTPQIFNELWNILLNENNQLNICYIYEAILGSYDTRLDVILEKLKQSHTLTPNQQRSVISVAYTYCMRRSLADDKTRETVTTHLLCLTLCNNSETRILAQMSLYKLLKTEKFQNILLQGQIIQSIEIGMGEQLNENVNDIRLHMHENELYKNVFLVILFVTKAPFDDMFFSNFAYFFNSTKFFANIKPNLKNVSQDQIIKCREAFVKRNK